MSAISALRIDTLDVPSELNGRGCPNDFGSVAFARWILFAVIGSCEEQFVGSTVGSNPFVVRGPIECHDVRRVLVHLSFEAPVTGVVNVEAIVMRSDSEHGLVRTESHNLNPLR